MTETLIADGDKDDYVEEGLRAIEEYANPLEMVAVAPNITRHENTTRGIQKQNIAAVMGPMTLRRSDLVPDADGGYRLG